jgi:general secretion pathway protein H
MTSRVDHQSGFTLFELLVALAVVGLLLVVLPSSFASVERARLDTTVERIAGDLRRARSRAILTAIPQRFVLDLDRRRFGIEGLQAGTLPDDLTVQMAGAREDAIASTIMAIRFFPDGTSTGGRIRLDSAARFAEVRVDWLTGRVGIQGG